MDEIENRKPRVLITYVEAGMGHIVSAQAIAESLKKMFSDKIEIVESYILRDSENPILPKYEDFLVKNTQLYSKLPAYGDIQFASMHILGAQNTLKLIHNTIFRTQTKATMEEYKKYTPDVIVCTHYFLLYAAIEYKRKYNEKAIIVAYCPDNNVHGWWDNRADVFYTNNPMATEQAYENKFRSGHVREAFYATRSNVMQSNESKEFYRKKFGIPLDKFAVVIADGVYAKAKTRKVCRELFKTDVPLTICVLAGKNEVLKEKFDRYRDEGKLKKNITLLTFGFIQDAPQLYGACDLFITKAGPNAVLDSVMMGTPIITDYCATPIERATKKLFVERFFCGYHLVSPRRIRKQVELLVKRPDLLEGIRKTLSFFDKSKNGADEIAADIGELIFNGEERMKKILQEEEESIYELLSERAEEVRKKGEERITKVNENSIKRTEGKDEEDVERISERTDKRIERINAGTEKRVERINEMAKLASETVYDEEDDTSSHYSAQVARQRMERIAPKPEDKPDTK